MASVAVFRSVLRRPTVPKRSNKRIHESAWQWNASRRHQSVSCNASKADRATTGPVNASVRCHTFLEYSGRLLTSVVYAGF